jgi:copper chaperone CopZ
MTIVEIHYQYTQAPTEDDLSALGKLRDVYGIRHLVFQPEAKTVTVEYDATRLNAATVGKLLHSAGLDVVELPPAILPEPVVADAK